MIDMKKIFFGFSFLCLIQISVKAQVLDSLRIDSLTSYEYRLSGLAKEMVSNFDELTRISSGKNFIINLGRALKIENSYFYPFDSIKNVIILKSPDDFFRVITWNIATNDEKFRYFGVIQMNPLMVAKLPNKDEFKNFYPLIDRSDSIVNFAYKELDTDHWFGCAYYKIIKTSNKKLNYYTLLGWDGSDNKRNKKVIEILQFKMGRPWFGAPVLDFKRKSIFWRYVFEFNNSATMGLRYDEKNKYLIYENIVPDKPLNTGNFEFYFPDGSFDYCIWKNGKWEKQQGFLQNEK
jgi:hypothetical protein